MHIDLTTITLQIHKPSCKSRFRSRRVAQHLSHPARKLSYKNDLWFYLLFFILYISLSSSFLFLTLKTSQTQREKKIQKYILSLYRKLSIELIYFFFNPYYCELLFAENPVSEWIIYRTIKSNTIIWIYNFSLIQSKYRITIDNVRALFIYLSVEEGEP